MHELGLRFELFITELFFLVVNVSVHFHRIPAELTQHDGAFVLGHAKGSVIGMQAFQLRFAHALIVPTADRIDNTRIVFRAHVFRDFRGVKLPPAFVERHPNADTGTVEKLFERFVHHLHKRNSAPFVFAGKVFIIVVRVVKAQERQVRDMPRIILPAAAHEILPNDKPQPIAMIIPTHRLDLDMFSNRIKAHFFERRQLVDRGLIARISQKPVRPVALIEHAVEKVGFAVEREPHFSRLVPLFSKRSHAEIGRELIPRVIRDRKIIKLGIFRRPKLKIVRERNFARIFFADNFFFLVVNDDFPFFRFLRKDTHRFRARVRVNFGRFDIVLWHTFHPNRLPNPALGRIPYPTAAIALFAARVAVSRAFVGNEHLNFRFAVY